MFRDRTSYLGKVGSRCQSAFVLAAALAALLVGTGWIPVVHALVDDMEGREERESAAPPSEGEWPTEEEVQALADHMAELLATEAPRQELERVGRALADHVKYRLELENDRNLGVTPTAYAQTLIRAGAPFPKAQVWQVAARGLYGARNAGDAELLYAALPLFDPHVDGGESLMAYQVLGYLAGGYNSLESWGEEGALPDWSIFVEYFDRFWPSGFSRRDPGMQELILRGREKNQENITALVFFLVRVDPHRLLELLVTPEGTLPPEVEGDDNRAERQRIATLLRDVDTMVWKQRHHFIDDEETTPEAVEAIASLAASEIWWARLGALQLMYNQPELWRMEIFNTLSRDPNDLIRKETGVLKMVVREATTLVHENLRPLRDKEDDDDDLPDDFEDAD